MSSLLTHSPESHCQHLRASTLTHPFLTFFFPFVLSLLCYFCVKATDLKPKSYQAEQTSGEGPAVPEAVAVARQALRGLGIIAPWSLQVQQASLLHPHSSSPAPLVLPVTGEDE